MRTVLPDHVKLVFGVYLGRVIYGTVGLLKSVIITDVIPYAVIFLIGT